MLTSYSINIALRVVTTIADMTKGVDPHSDQAFSIVSKVLQRLADKGSVQDLVDAGTKA